MTAPVLVPRARRPQPPRSGTLLASIFESHSLTSLPRIAINLAALATSKRFARADYRVVRISPTAPSESSPRRERVESEASAVWRLCLDGRSGVASDAARAAFRARGDAAPDTPVNGSDLGPGLDLGPSLVHPDLHWSPDPSSNRHSFRNPCHPFRGPSRRPGRLASVELVGLGSRPHWHRWRQAPLIRHRQTAPRIKALRRSFALYFSFRATRNMVHDYGAE